MRCGSRCGGPSGTAKVRIPPLSSPSGSANDVAVDIALDGLNEVAVDFGVGVETCGVGEGVGLAVGAVVELGACPVGEGESVKHPDRTKGVTNRHARLNTRLVNKPWNRDLQSCTKNMTDKG